MMQEEKQILLKDLCARLPYGVKCATYTASDTLRNDKETIFYIAGANIVTYESDERGECYMYWQIKPYLRPMNSMTEEEMGKCRIERGRDLSGECGCESDYLNSIHIDYRGLIEKGLALEAPEGMYKTE